MRVIEAVVVGFFVIAALLAVTGATGTFRLYGLSQTIQEVFQQNYAAVEVVQGMQGQLDGMHRTYMAHLQSQQAPDLAAFQQRITTFRANLGTLRQSRTLPAKLESLETLERRFERFVEISGTDLKGPTPSLQHYHADVAPLLADLEESLRHLVELDQVLMLEQSQQAVGAARSGVQALAILGLLGLLVSYAYYHVLSHSLVQPLRRMLHQTRRIAQGEMALRLSSERHDEFGQMSVEINRIVDQLDQLVQQRDAFRAQRQQIAQTLLEQYAGPAIVFDLRREVSLTNTPGRTLLLSSNWQEDLEKLQSSIRSGESQQTGVQLTDGLFRLNQAPMRDRQGNLIGTLITLFLLDAEGA